MVALGLQHRSSPIPLAPPLDNRDLLHLLVTALSLWLLLPGSLLGPPGEPAPAKTSGPLLGRSPLSCLEPLRPRLS